MAINIIKQYSVFLINQPGALHSFSNLFLKENVNIIAISQDVRYDAAVVRIAIDSDSESVSHAITKAGFTSVKTDAICLDAPNRVGLISDITEILGKQGINISAVYGSISNTESSRLIIVVNDIAKAVDVLAQSGMV
ncbi:hypothetical protein AAIR98_001623 [Elusimicrobium simillimum]|uniref:ACT domain-containing protein n=1 Tax=Elusimicrobium simillimum TaxID=3143438 RepID=UPI003C6EC03B